MSRVLNLKQKATLHNKFHLVLNDAQTGAVKQEGYAYNIILNKGFSQIINHFVHNSGASLSNVMYWRLMRAHNAFTMTIGKTARFGGVIMIGEGITEPTVEDTSLAGFITSMGSDYYDHEYDLDNLRGSYTQKVVFDETVAQNKNITEVGLGFGPLSTDISTRALVEDAEGNPIAIEKGTLDVLTVYSTVYLELSHSYGSGVLFVEGDYANALLSMFALNASCGGGGSVSNRARLRVGTSRDSLAKADTSAKTSVTDKVINNTLLVTSTGNKIVTIGTRFGISEGNNASGLSEIGADLYVGGAEFSPAYTSTGHAPHSLFRALLPITGVWEGHTITDEELGTGDGIEDTFTTTWASIVENSEVLKVNDVTQTKVTDYTINYATGEIVFESGSIPANGHAVTCTYDVEFIPKDINHVLDISFTIQFGDGNAV